MLIEDTERILPENEEYYHGSLIHRCRRRVLDVFGIPWAASPDEQEKYLLGLSPSEIKEVLSHIPPDSSFK